MCVGGIGNEKVYKNRDLGMFYVVTTMQVDKDEKSNATHWPGHLESRFETRPAVEWRRKAAGSGRGTSG